MTDCAKCFHSKENHGVVCSGSITCMCTKYEEPFLFAFAQRVEKEKHERKSIRQRCEYILENIPQSRNAGEKTFAKIYWEVWEGLRIRVNNPQALDKKTWDRLTNADTINREKRRCKQWNEELGTYDPKVKLEQTAIYQALMEMAIEN